MVVVVIVVVFTRCGKEVSITDFDAAVDDTIFVFVISTAAGAVIAVDFAVVRGCAAAAVFIPFVLFEVVVIVG